jgi:hypothetical protein
VAGSCKSGIETTGSIYCGEFLDQLRSIYFLQYDIFLAVSTVKEPKSYEMVKIIVRDRQDLNEFQADIPEYMLAGVIWRSSNKVRNTW